MPLFDRFPYRLAYRVGYRPALMAPPCRLSSNSLALLPGQDVTLVRLTGASLLTVRHWPSAHPADTSDAIWPQQGWTPVTQFGLSRAGHQ